ncbi:MAG: SSU ribosomal protein S14p (S29e) @ SSU ribosomal protein S14p (S29e), zinc-dependent, partial [uncultured Solirubrobacteraceae bacterium]
GQDVSAGPPVAALEVQDPGIQPLPPLRPGPSRISQVRPVPDLPARDGPRGVCPGHDEVFVV